MKTIAGGVIAIVLLGIYAWLIVMAALAVFGVPVPTFNPAMARVLSVTTGLVSALVIAELSIARAGEMPAARLLSPHAGARARHWLRTVSTLYLLIWLVAGLGAFMIGLLHPHAQPALTSTGQAWFGIAVAAAYAYLGLQPSGQ